MQRTSSLLFLLLLIFSSHILAQTPYFWAKEATETVFSFHNYIEFEAYQEPSQSDIQRHINYQLSYMVGSFENAIITHAPKMDHHINITSHLKIADHLWRADYDYTGTVVVRDEVSESLKVNLPIRPYEIYKNSIVEKNGRRYYPCSSNSDHTEATYFWYFWNPENPGCPLKIEKDYLNVTGSIERKNNTVQTFPEYEKMVVDGKLDIYLIIGMDNNSKPKNPNTSGDLNALTWRELKEYLLNNDYKISPEETNLYKTLYPQLEQTSFLEVYFKDTPRGKVIIRLFFTPSVGFQAKHFYLMLKEAMMNSSLIIYSGHSGIGEYLDLSKMSVLSDLEFKANQNRYQIYFFNGCNSYPYYNTQYFNLKKTALDPQGTLNLDILTNGLATYFNNLTPSNEVVLKALFDWTEKGMKTSYQQIILGADSDNLLSINGDEDNSTTN
jgi:hypothetical protein